MRIRKRKKGASEKTEGDLKNIDQRGGKINVYNSPNDFQLQDYRRDFLASRHNVAPVFASILAALFRSAPR